MTQDPSSKLKKQSQEDFEAVSNQISLILAQRHSLIKSWTASISDSAPPEKTSEELDAEDAALLHSQPFYLGLGAPIPAQFQLSEIERNNRLLRARLSGSKSLKSKQTRDGDEKSRYLKKLHKEIDNSSDEELGRSSVGKAKKMKYNKTLEDSDSMLLKKKNNLKIDEISCNELNKENKSLIQSFSDNLSIKTKSELENMNKFSPSGVSGDNNLENNIQENNIQLDEQKATINLEPNLDIPSVFKSPNVNSKSSLFIDSETKKKMRKKEKRKRQKLRIKVENKSKKLSTENQTTFQ